MIEPLYKKNDYIVNRYSGDLAIVKGVTKKNYYQFKEYYDSMFKELKDLKNYTYELQVNYQKFFELCNEEEKNMFDKIIEEKNKKKVGK